MIIPNWNAPRTVEAFTLLHEDPPLAHTPERLNQVHGKEVVLLPESTTVPRPLVADAAITRTPDTICVVQTADCLPILVTNLAGNEVAAIHAGWKGLIAGVIEETFLKIQSAPKDCIAWIGPAICGKCFEVGPEVREAFVQKDPRFSTCFEKGKQDRWFGNLSSIARIILTDLRLASISQSGICTMEDLRCDSYRRQKGTLQRMLSCIAFRMPS